ncbi:MAG: oxidoreductase [Armatimonadota bacterium]|nr:oxidoreductase [Armatimonadota bacterium]MDR7486483.1 oxidoreductase [Armatimonadota bacterium]MDR7532249.1 oxidoreductase [Armatimonadota bacterium]MDR7537176.1 oxidoreductase [Armatimonadota bacterium]
MRLATVWLGGCSGCHMSFLDLDERLLALAPRIRLVYSPFMDTKTFPDQVDVTLVEGAVANEDHLALIRTVRARTRVLVAFGDCAVTGNVTAMRNPLGPAPVLQRAYAATAAPGSRAPDDDLVPRLLARVLPVHQVVAVDVWLPGCPPSAETIYAALTDLLDGRAPATDALRFG